LFSELFEKHTIFNTKDFYLSQKFTRKGKLLNYDSAKASYSKSKIENGRFKGKEKIDKIIISLKNNLLR
jgi:hypothetical protein